MAFVVVFGILVALIVTLALVYARQRRDIPHDVEGARKSAARGPHGYSNVPGVTGDIGG